MFGVFLCVFLKTRQLSRQVEIDSSGPRPGWPSPVLSEARGLFAALAEGICRRTAIGPPAVEFGESHSRRSRSRQCQPIFGQPDRLTAPCRALPYLSSHE